MHSSFCTNCAVSFCLPDRFSQLAAPTASQAKLLLRRSTHTMTSCAVSGGLGLQVIEALQRGAAHESLVCCAAYLLGEYGRQVEAVPLREQFGLLQERFVTVSSEAKVRWLSLAGW